VADFRDLLFSRTWTDDAACADSPDPDAFFIEGNSSDRDATASLRALGAFLTCQRCPVRVECLSEALRTWRVPIPTNRRVTGIGVRAVGTWGATTYRDREAVASLPIPEAVARLEADLPQRIARRIEAVGEKHPSFRPPVPAG